MLSGGDGKWTWIQKTFRCIVVHLWTQGASAGWASIIPPIFPSWWRLVWEEKGMEWYQSSIRRELGPWMAPGYQAGYCTIQLLEAKTSLSKGEQLERLLQSVQEREQALGWCGRHPVAGRGSTALVLGTRKANSCPNQLYCFPDKWQTWLPLAL